MPKKSEPQPAPPPGISGMKCTGWKSVFPVEDTDRLVKGIAFPPEDYVHVAAGYELHVTVQAKPSPALARARKKGLAP